MKITSTITGLDEVQRELLRIGTLPRQALAATAEDVETFVAGQAAKHNKTGALVQSTYLRRIDEGWEVGHDGQRAPEALFVHWGTKPHVIKPRNKKALRWPGGGKFHFALKVNHPGYAGDPWMTRAAALVPIMFDKHLQALLAQQRGA